MAWLFIIPIVLVVLFGVAACIAVSGMPEPSRVIPPDRWERLTNFSGVIIFDEMLPRGDLMLLDIDVVNGEARVSVSGKIFAGKWIAKAQDKDVSEEEM